MGTVHFGCECMQCRRHAAHAALGLVGRPITSDEWRTAEALAGIAEPTTTSSRPDVSADPAVVAETGNVAKAEEVYDAARLVWQEAVLARAAGREAVAYAANETVRDAAARRMAGLIADDGVAREAMDAAWRVLCRARAELARVEAVARMRA